MLGWRLDLDGEGKEGFLLVSTGQFEKGGCSGDGVRGGSRSVSDMLAGTPVAARRL